MDALDDHSANKFTSGYSRLRNPILPCETFPSVSALSPRILIGLTSTVSTPPISRLFSTSKKLAIWWCDSSLLSDQTLTCLELMLPRQGTLHISIAEHPSSLYSATISIRHSNLCNLRRSQNYTERACGDPMPSRDSLGGLTILNNPLVLCYLYEEPYLSRPFSSTSFLLHAIAQPWHSPTPSDDLNGPQISEHGSEDLYQEYEGNVLTTMRDEQALDHLLNKSP